MSFKESLELYETTFAPLDLREKMIASVFYNYGYLDRMDKEEDFDLSPPFK